MTVDTKGIIMKLDWTIDRFGVGLICLTCISFLVSGVR